MVRAKNEKGTYRKTYCLARRMYLSLTAALFLFFLSFHFFFFTFHAEAELIDRVVAFVDEEAITLSEFQSQYDNIRTLSPNVTREEVIQTIINRKLLLREARKYRIEGPNEEEMMKEYIDLKVRAFIRVDETEIQQFYEENNDQFEGKQFDAARDEIETYLTEKKVNERLKETLERLKKDAYIKIQLDYIPEAR